MAQEQNLTPPAGLKPVEQEAWLAIARRQGAGGRHALAGPHPQLFGEPAGAARGGGRGSRPRGACMDSWAASAWGRVAGGSNDRKRYVVDAGTGAVVQQFEAGGPLSASPAIAGGRLVIGSQDGKLFCLG